MKIYTRTGDSGRTSIVGGTRLSKDAPRIEAYGTVDELNAMLGVIAAHKDTCASRRDFIRTIQNSLFNIGAYLAGAPDCGVTKDRIAELENDIDQMSRHLPALHSFIIPGGCSLAAQAHLARTVCRRAERRIVSCCGDLNVDPSVLELINRLSDWLFIFARMANLNAQVSEPTWHK